MSEDHKDLDELAAAAGFSCWADVIAWSNYEDQEEDNQEDE